MEKVIAVVAALVLLGCEEPPKTPPPPRGPEPWQLKEQQDKEDAERRSKASAPVVARKEYPPRRWQGRASPPPPWVLDKMGPTGRRVWTAYADLPPERRTNQAWKDAYAETRGKCVGEAACYAELEVMAGFALQGWFEGALPVWRGGKLWVNAHPDRDTCLGMFDELAQDAIASSSSTPFAGIFCGTVARSEATGEYIVRDPIERRWKDK